MSTTLSDTDARAAQAELQKLRDTVNGVIFGQKQLVDLVIVALLARGHILLEGLPGLGKTELVKTFSKALHLDTKRVQFTPDLLPGDITGNPVMQEEHGTRRFVFQRGPVFTNHLLADEINRAGPKTQAALLEAMQERSVTAMGETHRLPDPFFVFATQNPVELEGTYPLPEAQVDRFLFKLDVLRTDTETLERIIGARRLGGEPATATALEPGRVLALGEMARNVYLPDPVTNYIARLVNATHPGESEPAKAVRFGASPRAAIGLAAAARARALLEGRTHASQEDVRAIAAPVLRHRVIPTYEARLEGITGDRIVADLLASVPLEAKALPKGLSAAKL